MQNIIGPFQANTFHAHLLQRACNCNTHREAQALQRCRTLTELPHKRQVDIAGKGADPLTAQPSTPCRLLLRGTGQPGDSALLNAPHHFRVG